MYVCICNAIRETDFRSAARRCGGGVEATFGCLGRTPQCRQCFEDAEDIIADEMSQSSFGTGMGIAAAA